MDSHETIVESKYRILFVVLLIACLSCIDMTNRLNIHAFTAPIVTALLLSWPTKYCSNTIRPFVQLVVGELFLGLCIVDCYCQEFFGTPITPQILRSLFLSNTRETCEFLSTFVGGYILLHWRITFLLILVIILPICLFCRWKISPIYSRKLKITGIIILLFCILAEVPTTFRYVQLFLQKQNIEKIEGLIFRHYHEEVPTPLHRIAFAYYASTQSSEILDRIKLSTFTTDIDSCSYTSPHIVLIIGESYNKHHSSLYGYHIPTTPLQQERKNRGELFPFSNAITPWNITSNVFLDIFSLWESGNDEKITAYPLFPILFRRAGYTVSFFSNQYLLKGFLKGATNQAGNFFLADSELSDSLFDYRNQRSSKYDMGIVEQFKNYKSERGYANYTLDIIHLIGQHFEYSMRYPHSKATFSEKDYSERTIDKEAKRIVMHYDNATKYNDEVLDSLLSLHENDNAVIIYLSDHGEEVYDELPVHGRLFQTPTKTQAKNEFEVPMWIWCSRKYQDNYPDIITCIHNSVNNPILTDNLPQILLFLAGIKCKWTDSKRNVLSPQYKSKPRIIGGRIDFDKL